MTTKPGDDITELLQAWSRDSPEVGEALLPKVYAELARLASSKLRMERDATLQTGDLVNEAYLRLVDQDRANWDSRSHFYAIAAKIMRRVLVDRARKRSAGKRIPPKLTVPLEHAPEPAVEANMDLIDLDRALERLAELDPRQARLVELRTFAGLTLEESAEMLEISRSTANREWRTAKLWLRQQLGKRESPQDCAKAPGGAGNEP